MPYLYLEWIPNLPFWLWEGHACERLDKPLRITSSREQSRQPRFASDGWVGDAGASRFNAAVDGGLRDLVWHGGDARDQ
jgi:hypothetical protein